MRSAPYLASASATARPRPSAHPVIRMRLFFRTSLYGSYSSKVSNIIQFEYLRVVFQVIQAFANWSQVNSCIYQIEFTPFDLQKHSMINGSDDFELKWNLVSPTRRARTACRSSMRIYAHFVPPLRIEIQWFCEFRICCGDSIPRFRSVSGIGTMPSRRYCPKSWTKPNRTNAAADFSRISWFVAG